MTADERASFGAVLRRVRTAAGLTQEELAERAGLSRRGINDLERGARLLPRKETVTLLADALQLEGDDRRVFLAAARRPVSLTVPSSALAPDAAGLPGELEATASSPLPEGTVTFLFTDIAGSTRLLQRLGAAAALRETIGAPLSVPDLTEMEQAVAEARAALGEAAWAAAFAEGQALSLEQAIAEALETA
jgi:transcriptional regulator with XRE-family HTH domain